MKQTIRLVIVIIAILFSQHGWLKPLAVGAQPPEPEELPSQKPSALAGKGIYEARCTRCHGLQGAGDGAMAVQLPAPPPSFLDVDHMRQVTPADYFDAITNGDMESLMPPWRDELSAQERWDVLFYTWSLGTTRERIETGEKIYGQQCVECHGEAGDKVEAIDLGDQATLAALSQADLAAGVRDGHTDVDWKDTLTDDERWAVLDYVRTFTYETVFAAEAATGDGVIEGRIVDGTAGAQPDLSDLQLTLIPTVGQTTLTPITTTVEADGSFRIEGLPTGSERNYGLRATYHGIDYLHPELINLTDNPTASVTLHVYETTTEDAAIDVDRNHVIIDFANNQLQIAEVYIFRNSGDRTYVGDGETLKFLLPEGARNLQFSDPAMNQSTELVENGVVDTLPFPPGNRQVFLSYSVPYDGRSTTLEKQIAYPTRNLNVLIADVGVKVDAGPLVAGEPVSTQTNVRFLNYVQQNVPAGEQLSLKLSNLPRGSTSSVAGVPADRSGTLRWFGFGLLALTLAFFAAYPALRPRLLAEELLEDDTSEAVLRRQRQMLLEELADLDEAYEAGEIAESNYTEARAEIKADLMDVMRQLQSLEEAGAKAPG